MGSFSFTQWWPFGLALLALLTAGSYRLLRWWHRRLRESDRRKSEAEIDSDWRWAQKKFEDGHKGLFGAPTKTIYIIHDISWENEPRRDTLYQYLSLEEAFRILKEIRMTRPRRHINVILHTPGGELLASEMVSAALKAHKGGTTAYVPYMAMSGGTMIALATQKIVMGKHATLGPIDTQIEGFPAHSFDWLVNKKSIDAIDDVTLLVSRTAQSILKSEGSRASSLLNDAHKKNGKCMVTDALVSDGMNHADRVTAKMASDLGADISEKCGDDVYAIIDTRLQQLRMLRRPESAPAQNSGAAKPTASILSARLT